jgi:hypothetical protein
MSAHTHDCRFKKTRFFGVVRKSNCPTLLTTHYSPLSMLIKPDKLQHWLNHFYGYGSWQAPLWFVAYEESGGETPEEVAEKLNYFTEVHPQVGPTLCEIRKVYRSIAIRWDGPKASQFKTRYEYRFGENAVKHGLWKNLIAFAHAYRDEPLEDPLAYQRESFAIDREALLRLYPLPVAHHAWYYSWLDLPEKFAFLKNKALYQEHLYEQRIDTILHNIDTYHPRVVLMYGMENINGLKASVQKHFPDVTFKMFKAVKQHIPQHHYAELNGTKLIITTQLPALRHNRIETGFDWAAFGETMRIGDR